MYFSVVAYMHDGFSDEAELVRRLRDILPPVAYPFEHITSNSPSLRDAPSLSLDRPRRASRSFPYLIHPGSALAAGRRPVVA